MTCPQTWKSYISILILILSIPTSIALACLGHFIKRTFIGTAMKNIDDDSDVPAGTYQCVALLDPNQSIEMVLNSARVVLVYQVLVMSFFLISMGFFIRNKKDCSAVVFGIDVVNVIISIYNIAVLSMFLSILSTQVKTIRDEKGNNYKCLMYPSQFEAIKHTRLIYALIGLSGIQLVYFVLHINAKQK